MKTISNVVLCAILEETAVALMMKIKLALEGINFIAEIKEAQFLEGAYTFKVLHRQDSKKKILISISINEFHIGFVGCEKSCLSDKLQFILESWSLCPAKAKYTDGKLVIAKYLYQHSWEVIEYIKDPKWSDLKQGRYYIELCKDHVLFFHYDRVVAMVVRDDLNRIALLINPERQ